MFNFLIYKDMKSNLVIRKYQTQTVKGVKSAKEVKSFFGSKLIDIEDDIYINDISIQYSEVVNKVSIQNDHYQYYDVNLLHPEVNILRSLDDVKYENHSIDVYSQKDPSVDAVNKNYEWIMVINARNILREYLFLRLKESRVFKTIRSEDLLERNINTYINNYIDTNLLNRYNISELAFYANYFDVIQDSTVFTKGQVLKGPNFNKNVFNESKRIKNVNIMTPDYLNNLDTVKIIYNQIKDYRRYKFDYYFTISYKKI
jgi:hypothetical protein